LVKYTLLYAEFTSMKSACINGLILEVFSSITGIAITSNLRQEPRSGLCSEQDLETGSKIFVLQAFRFL